MNQTSATTTSQPGASLLPDGGVGVITTAHLIVMLIVAIAAIAIIVVGVRRARTRRQADRQVEAHAREAGVVEAPAPSTPVAPPAPPATVEPPSPAADVAPPVTPTTEPVATPVAPIDRQPDPLDDEPIAAAGPLDASPATVAPAPPSPAADPADGPLSQIKGVGPKLVTRLEELGITTVGQVAALDAGTAAALDAQLGAFSGRMARDRWIEQARLLAVGDRAGFEAVFGKL